MLSKEQLLGKLRNLPLNYPYADYDYLHSIDSVDARYTAGNDAVTDAMAKKFGIPEDHIPELAAARWLAARHACVRMKKRGITQAEASKLSGIDATLFSKYAAGERPFTPLPSTLPAFCYKVMEESCHKVMFGEEGEILLPALYANVVKALLNSDPEKNKALLKQANDIIRKNPTEPALIDLMRERIMQYCYEKGRRFANFFGEVPQRQIENRLFCLFNDESPSMLKVPFLMFLSFESGQALDYFISPECISWNRTYYYDGEEKVELKEGTVKTIISRCFSMNKENRREFLPILLKGAFDNIL